MMKNLLALLLLVQGTLALGQTKFDNRKLTLINDIVSLTTRQNINSFMENKGFKKGDIDEGEGEIKEVLTFSSSIEMLEIAYNKANKVSNIVCVYAGAINSVFIESELKSKGYTSKVVKQTVDGESITKNRWSIPSSKYNFLTYADEKEKIGVLQYGIY